MNAEIVSVGTEILLGSIANTDAQFISRELSVLGINMFYHTVVGDNPERLKNVLNIAKKRSDIIITTGGLGPTYDDLTKETVAECFGKKLARHLPSYEKICSYFKDRGRDMSPNNEKQAFLPEDCTVLPNSCGTAPGCAFEVDGVHVVMLPGPPRECLAMFTEQAIPYLKKFSDNSAIVSRNIHIFGMGEASVEQLLHKQISKASNPSVAPYAKDGECLLRVTAKADNENDAFAATEPVVKDLCDKLGDYVYGVDTDSLENTIISLLKSSGLTLSSAESCTGGLVSKKLTDIAGASSCFYGGVCVYTNEIKERMLGVSHETLEKYGAVSEQTAKELALNVRQKFGTDIGVGITGIAGPGGGTDEKPVGTVYIAVSSSDNLVCELCRSKGSRMAIREYSAKYALNMIRKLICKEYPNYSKINLSASTI